MTAQQLKNSILQMAVQGKLVPQNPDDEPASVLLERIKAEKQELMKAGKIKKDKKSSEIFRGASRNFPYHFCEQIGKEIRDISDEIPFEIPDTWEWIRCSSLGAIIRGSGIKRTETVENGIPCVRYGELYTTYNTSFTKAISFVPQYLFEQCKQIRYGDVLFTLTGENKPDIAKTVAYLGDSPVAVGGDLAYWTYHGMNPLYLVYFMASPYTIGRKVNLATGDIIVHISGDKVGSILIPVPPLAEQDRIVAKIQKLEPFIKEYDSKSVAVSTLNADFPEALKKSILQEAVQGRLVPQNSDDEPASVLLEHIRAEKQALIKAGKIKKDKHESVIITRDKIPYEIIDGKERCIAHEVPFEIPESWCWCRLGTIFQHNTGKALNSSNHQGAKMKYITTSNLYWDRFELDKLKEMLFTENELEKCTVNKGDLLVCEGGDIGRAAIWNYDYSMRIQNHIHKLRPYTSVEMYFFYYIFYLYKRAGLIGGKGIGIQGLSSNVIDKLLIPLPPLAEQKRIVAKIEELMPIINRISK